MRSHVHRNIQQLIICNNFPSGCLFQEIFLDSPFPLSQQVHEAENEYRETDVTRKMKIQVDHIGNWKMKSK